MPDDPLEIYEDAIVAIGHGEDPVDDIRPWNVQAFLWNFRPIEVEERFGFVAEQFCD